MIRKAIPEQKPIILHFASFIAAQEHKRLDGGWLFVSDQAAGAIWFDAQVFTASQVMKHPATRGQSGRIL